MKLDASSIFLKKHFFGLTILRKPELHLIILTEGDCVESGNIIRANSYTKKYTTNKIRKSGKTKQKWKIQEVKVIIN